MALRLSVLQIMKHLQGLVLFEVVVILILINIILLQIIIFRMELTTTD